MKPYRKKIAILAVCLVLAGASLSFKGAVIPAKAWLSVHLMNHAWAKTAKGDDSARPWPWMDSTPVAHITVPRLNKDYVVMRGVSGSVLAFAPGWNEGTGYPGRKGISLISAHRDTHFSFLRYLKKEDLILLENAEGVQKRYMVEELSVVQKPEILVPVEEQESVLLLSTCYPFSNFELGGDMRLVVIAREVKDNV